jgi:hypothetical protein
MAKFNIDGSWYEAPNYLEARKLAAAAKGSPAIPGLPKPVHGLVQQPAMAQHLAMVPKPVPKPASKPPVKFDTSKPGANSFDMLCYRGEKNNWWSPPEERLICGMTLYQPWNLQPGINSMALLFEQLRKSITENAFGKVDGYAQFLRAQGRPYALAFARTTSGSFTSDYNYVVKVSNARTFLWGPKLTLGEQVRFDEVSKVNADYIVLNADTLEASTILAFGHKCGTYEVTFLHDLSIANVVSVNGKPVSQLAIKNQQDLGFEEKVKMRKYLRHGTTWLG